MTVRPQNLQVNLWMAEWNKNSCINVQKNPMDSQPQLPRKASRDTSQFPRLNHFHWASDSRSRCLVIMPQAQLTLETRRGATPWGDRNPRWEVWRSFDKSLSLFVGGRRALPCVFALSVKGVVQAAPLFSVTCLISPSQTGTELRLRRDNTDRLTCL